MLVYIRRMGLVDDLLRLPVVHIAGTKGKGSTACMVEAMLRSAGLRTGMFTSPHLVSFRERFRLNGRPMAEHAFLGHFWHVWDGLHAAAPAERDEEDDADVPPVPGFFHLLTLLALAAFSREKVDVLVLEVGLGGRLDATNVVPRPVACGITRLDYDHVEVLGGTMAAIAAEKAGILKRACPAWTVQQSSEGAVVLARQAGAVGAPLAVVSPADQLARGRGPSSPSAHAGGGAGLAIGPAGRFQRENASLAIALAETFLVRTGRARAEDTCVPASMASAWVPAGPEEVARVVAVTAAAAAATAAAVGPSGAQSDAEALLSAPRCPAPPLEAALADGLASAHWPGRAHTVVARPASSDADSASCRLAILPGVSACDASSGDVVAFMDGAHTVASMREAAEWFVEASAAAAPSTRPPRARVLVFSCGQEKDAVQLMLPLLAVPWEAVVLCPMDSVRPSRHAAPSAALLVDRFFEREAEAARASGDALATAAAAGPAGCSGAGPSRATSEAGAHATSGSWADSPHASKAAAGEAWATTLAELWTAVGSDPRLEAARRAAGAVAEGARCAPVRAASVSAALGVAASARPDNDGPVHVMVSGSLYLVGDSLKAMGWRA
ncbi:hypothetical protein FNF29_00547 [Cafeteria roenbergensis]|uniref:tetrahydrofolate synthase n=1 Tax=Cafeteria roenbergensis TaxID=33653 RepID=A0A5A8CVX5_CAFRO|nr:hypothetical protein FNF29_00547 [Cafeteria roenbergensis]|eukprot:KAA0157195.1 hypothetical protein FNF29_00547 [Cafeteria roenbergensis]